jgi:hypothetical protein
MENHQLLLMIPGLNLTSAFLSSRSSFNSSMYSLSFISLDPMSSALTSSCLSFNFLQIALILSSRASRRSIAAYFFRSDSSRNCQRARWHRHVQGTPCSAMHDASSQSNPWSSCDCMFLAKAPTDPGPKPRGPETHPLVILWQGNWRSRFHGHLLPLFSPLLQRRTHKFVSEGLVEGLGVLN